MTVSGGLLTLELAGTFAFALNGALTGVQAARLDVVGVMTLGTITALGGGVTRDVLIGAVPPEAMAHWWFLAVAVVGSLLVFVASSHIARFTGLVTVLDAAGLSLFCVTGATKSVDFGLGAAQAIVLGTITAVGGGTYRDMLVRRVPVILTSGLYAIPAAVGASIAVLAVRTGHRGAVPLVLAAVVCFVIRMLGVRYNLNAPRVRTRPEAKPPPPPD